MLKVTLCWLGSLHQRPLPLFLLISLAITKQSISSQLDKIMELDCEKILGEGGYAIVFEDVWDEKPVAVKRIPTNKVASNEREEDALRMLNHQNVIKLFHVESDKNFR